jgi:hypothetical protein
MRRRKNRIKLSGKPTFNWKTQKLWIMEVLEGIDYNTADMKNQ